MKPQFFISFILILFVSDSLRGQIQLTRLIYSTEKILLARFVDYSGDSLIFISKDFYSNGGYDDTIILLQSQVFAPIAMTKEDEVKINKNVNPWLQQSKELLLFVHHKEGQMVFPYHSGIRIALENEVRWTNGPLVFEDSDFIELPEKITWDEMLQRVVDIEARFKPVNDLHEIKNPRKRNKALFQWLEDHMDEFHKECDFNADCGWGGYQDIVLRWITEANNIEDTWKASKVFQRIYPTDRKSFDSFAGVYSKSGETFMSAEGLDFLTHKALDHTQPLIERRQALVFLIHATSFILQDTFQNDPYFKKRSQAERQQDLLDQLMPLMYDDQLAFPAFISILRLSHSEAPEEAHRKNLSKLPELMEIYKMDTLGSASFNLRFTDFLLDNCTVAQWKSITGNDTLLNVSLQGIYYNEANQQLRFDIYYQAPEGLIRDKPKVRFEKWEKGILVNEALKEFSNEDGSNYRPSITYIQQLVDVSDLESLEWVFYLVGVAGDMGKYNWTSERGQFVKK